VIRSRGLRPIKTKAWRAVSVGRLIDSMMRSARDAASSSVVGRRSSASEEAERQRGGFSEAWRAPECVCDAMAACFFHGCEFGIDRSIDRPGLLASQPAPWLGRWMRWARCSDRVDTCDTHHIQCMLGVSSYPHFLRTPVPPHIKNKPTGPSNADEGQGTDGAGCGQRRWGRGSRRASPPERAGRGQGPRELQGGGFGIINGRGCGGLVGGF
jgi:hypothetical protein